MKSLNKEEVIRSFSLPDKINLGIKDTGDWSLHDIKESNHTLFVGGMGSGKSRSALMSAYAFLKGNPRGLLVVCDFYKGGLDYKDIPSHRKLLLTEYESGVIESINFIYNEMLVRKKIIRQNQSKNIWDCGVSLSPILFIIEECQGIQSELEWDKLHAVDNTLANKLKMILKEGSVCGITVFLLTTSFNDISLPSSLMKLINHKRIFKTLIDNSEIFKLNHLINYTELYKTLSNETVGRSVDESTVYQFLLLSVEFMAKNLDKDFGKIKALVELPIPWVMAKKAFKVSFFEGKTRKDFSF